MKLQLANQYTRYQSIRELLAALRLFCRHKSVSNRMQLHPVSGRLACHWHVSSRGTEAGCKLLLLYLLGGPTYLKVRQRLTVIIANMDDSFTKCQCPGAKMTKGYIAANLSGNCG